MAKALPAEPVADEPQTEAPRQTVEETTQQRFALRVDATPRAAGQQQAESDAQTEPEAPTDEEFRGDEGEEGEQPRDEQGRFAKGQTLRDRLSAEARERQAAQQRADRLESLLAQQQALLAKQMGIEPPSGPNRDPSAAPNPDDYPAGQFDPGYMQAAMDYRVNQALEQRIQAETHRQTQARLVNAEQQFAASHEDYHEAKAMLLNDPAIAHHPGIGGAIMASAHPAELIYALGSNPNIASNIARMDPVSAAMAIGRIEAIIEAGMQQRQPADSQPAAKPKQAPAPIRPVGTSSPPANADISSARTYAEFVAIREAQEKRRNGR